MRYFKTVTGRDGFALPIALFAIVIIGALVTGGFYTSSQEGRIATSTDLGSQAFYAAEYGLNQALGTYKNDSIVSDFEDPAVVSVDKGTRLVEKRGPSDSSTYSITVQLINPVDRNLYLIRSTGEVVAGQRTARRQVATVLRTLMPDMPADAALSIYGGLTAAGNSEIAGTSPASCSTGDVAGVVATDTSRIKTEGRGTISGSPQKDQDATLDGNALSNFGSITLDDLRSEATKVYEANDTIQENMQPVTSTDTLGNTVCEDTVQANWGDVNRATPPGACESYFPTIHAKGNMHLSSGSGQGILIVDGNLYADGNFDFYGVVIVMGTFYTAGTGNHFEGSVIVQGDGALNSESTTTGNSLVQYNRCTIENAFNQVFRPRPLKARSWMDMSAITRGEAID